MLAWRLTLLSGLTCRWHPLPAGGRRLPTCSHCCLSYETTISGRRAMPVVAFKKRAEKQQLLCTKCGSVGGAAPCDCGAQHLVYAKAGEIAKQLVAQFPGRSARRIAEESGVSFKTVARMRSGVSNDTPEKVTGRDGKQYAAKRKQRAKPAPDLDEQANP